MERLSVRNPRFEALPADARATAGEASAEIARELAFSSAPHPREEELLAWIRDYCEDRVNSYVIDERRTIPPYVVLDFGNRGLLGMQVPEQYGGLGFSTRTLLRLIETLASKDLTLALFVGLNNVLGVRPVLEAGSAQLKERYLPLLASGRELAAFALTEQAAGSNPLAIEATAQRLPGGSYRLTGKKIWSGSAAWSGLLNVFAKTVDASGRTTGISAFAIPQTSPGVRQGPEALTMGMRGMIQNEVEFDGVEVQSWQVLGRPGHGMRVAQDAMCFGRLTIAAACVGAMKLCFQLMMQYVSRRQVATGVLLDNPHTRSLLAETMHAIESLSVLIASVAEGIDAGQGAPPEVLAICKSASTEWLWKTADRVMQLAGGRGYIESNFIPQLFRDARVLRIFEGPTETLAHYVGSSALGNTQGLRNFLLGRVDAGLVALRYDAMLNEVRAWHAGRERDAAAWNWRCITLGEYVTQLVWSAVSMGRNVRPAVETWLLAELESSAAQLRTKLAAYDAISTAETLSQFGASLDRQLGRRVQCSPMPNVTLDPMFSGEHDDTTAPLGRNVAPRPQP